MMIVFECKRCGACCKGESTVSLSAEEITRIARYLNITKEELFKRYLVQKGRNRIEMQVKDKYCIFFDRTRKLCTIHPVKPERCKEWPFPPSIFKDEENFLIIQGFCPGLERLSFEDLKRIKT